MFQCTLRTFSNIFLLISKMLYMIAGVLLSYVSKVSWNGNPDWTDRNTQLLLWAIVLIISGLICTCTDDKPLKWMLLADKRKQVRGWKGDADIYFLQPATLLLVLDIKLKYRSLKNKVFLALFFLSLIVACISSSLFFHWYLPQLQAWSLCRNKRHIE